MALEHGVNANLVFMWKRQRAERAISMTSKRPAVLLPVTIDPLPPIAAAIVVAPGSGAAPVRATPSGLIEIEFGDARVRLRGAVDEASVRYVPQTLREAA